MAGYYLYEVFTKLSLLTRFYCICHKRLTCLIVDGLFGYLLPPVDVEDSFEILKMLRFSKALTAELG